MKEIVATVEDVFKAHGTKRVDMPPKSRVIEPEGRHWHAMPAYVEPLEVAGIKWIYDYPLNPTKYGLPWTTGTITLNDPKTGAVKCIMECNWVTWMRTGAAAAVGAKYLARKGSKVVGLIGAGNVGRANLMALNEVMDIKQVKVADILPASRKKYVDEMRKMFNFDIKAVDTNEKAVRGSDITVSATHALERFIAYEWVEPGELIISVGGLNETMGLIKRVDKIIVDNLQQNLPMVQGYPGGGGTLPEAFIKGFITTDDIYAELGAIVAGRKKGRVRDDERILYKPSGMGSEDVAVAYRLYQLAQKKNLGQKLSLA